MVAHPMGAIVICYRVNRMASELHPARFSCGQHRGRTGCTARTGSCAPGVAPQADHRGNRLGHKPAREQIKATMVKRKNVRDGRGAAEHLIAALQRIYKQAIPDGILTENENPAGDVPKPRRLQSTTSSSWLNLDPRDPSRLLRTNYRVRTLLYALQSCRHIETQACSQPTRQYQYTHTYT